MTDLQLLQTSYDDRVYKYGRYDGVSTSNTIIWDVGGEYKGFMDTAETVSVLSSSAHDKVGGGGCTSIQIFGLVTIGGQLKRASEVLVINGTDAVTTVNAYNTVYRARSYTSEDGNAFTGPNHGDITIKNSKNNICAKILATNGQTLMAIWQNAENEYGKLLNVNVYPENDATVFTDNSLDVDIIYKNLGTNSWNTGGSLVFSSNMILHKYFDKPYLLLPGVKLMVMAKLTGGGPISVSADFEVELYPYE